MIQYGWEALDKTEAHHVGILESIHRWVDVGPKVKELVLGYTKKMATLPYRMYILEIKPNSGTILNILYEE